MEGEGTEAWLRRSEVAVIEEWNGTASSLLTKTATITVTGDSVRKSGRSFSHLLRRILDAFVPEVENLFSLVGIYSWFCKVVQGAEGFPSSVTRDYVPFQVWDSLQGLSTYMRTMLSTQALLSAIGVGDKSATVIGATFHWFLRDLTGMLGGVLFTFYQGANLDSNAKMWRLVADLMNDLGKYILLAGKHTISVIMHRDSTAADVLQAFLHALVLAKLDDKDRYMHLESRSWMAKNYEDFVLKLQSLGWRTERLLSPSVAWKAHWFISSSDEKVD
ncbi:UNVERIFIED_CONTAM: protein root UVB sensitive 3 [Sesamum calycinum]|uniref:Protein root UVB sensitive 3 n=1 Tax=Sesamum calycinum TaxID=2727403 RepID=A0AAW2PPM7_9LAMI